MTEMSAAEAATVARFEACEPAPESWDGLREALAYAISDVGAPSVDYAWRYADAVLALPEVAALRAKAAAADRARECVDGMDPIEVALGGLNYAQNEIHRALNGDPEC